MGAPTVNHQARAHALLAPSSAARWIGCTPSAQLEEAERKRVGSHDSEASREGTLAHEFADLALQLYTKAITTEAHDKAADKLRADKLYTLEMESQVAKYRDFVVAQYQKEARKWNGAELIPEQRYDLTRYVPESFGTADATVLGRKMITIADLKYGRGVQVYAANNAQLRLYALGAIEHYAQDFERVQMVIIQPRLDHYDYEIMTVKELRDWGFRVAQRAAHLAVKGQGAQKVGAWCKFCDVAYRCKAQADNAAKLAAYDFADPKTLTDDQLLAIYEHLDSFKSWATLVEKYVYNEALNGKSWEGFKLVEGRSSRKWSNPERTGELLQAEMFDDNEIYKPRTLRGIGDLEALLGKKQFNVILEGHTYKSPASPKLVPEDHGGTPYSNHKTAAEDFKA